MTTLDHRCVRQRLPAGPVPTTRHLDAPADWRVVLANDALSPEAAKNKCRYLAGQAARRWLANEQAFNAVVAAAARKAADFDASLTEGRSA